MFLLRNGHSLLKNIFAFAKFYLIVISVRTGDGGGGKGVCKDKHNARTSLPKKLVQLVMT